MKERMARSILIKQMKFDRCMNKLRDAINEIYDTPYDDDYQRVDFTDEAFELLGVPDEGTIFREGGGTFSYTQDGVYDEYHQLMCFYDMSIEKAVGLFIDKVKADMMELYEECELVTGTSEDEL